MEPRSGIFRLGIMLMLDILIFGFCVLFFFLGKLLFFSSAGSSEEEAIFLPVIMYHSIFEGTPQDYIVTPEQAESDLVWLSSHGYTAVSAQQLCDYTLGTGELPEKPVMITLDDGYYNNLSVYLPLLEKYDMCAVVSVVGSYTELLAAADPHADAYSYLTWEDIRTLNDSGRVEIGCHTYDMHSLKNGRYGCMRMKDESAEDYIQAFSEDTGLLRTALSANCGIMPSVFAYPFGGISHESLPVLKDHGIRMTLTCYERPNYITRDPECLYGIFRYNRSGLYSTEEFMQRLLQE
jgi:peptidoglycan/xylan/chitin deacetylase (PgdA/CDA1 family)